MNDKIPSILSAPRPPEPQPIRPAISFPQFLWMDCTNGRELKLSLVLADCGCKHLDFFFGRRGLRMCFGACREPCPESLADE